MAIGKVKNILIFSRNIKGTYTMSHDVLEQNGKIFCTTKGTTWMPRLHSVYHSDNISSCLLYYFFELFCGLGHDNIFTKVGLIQVLANLCGYFWEKKWLYLQLKL